MAIIAVAIIFALYKSGYGFNKNVVFKAHLKDNAIKVDGSIYTLEDVAFYIAYEEMTVEKDALIYDPDDPNKYWNIHTFFSKFVVEHFHSHRNVFK